MDHTETVYLVTLGIVSIWVATCTDMLFVLIVKLWRRFLSTKHARRHCRECIMRQLRPRTAHRR